MTVRQGMRYDDEARVQHGIQPFFAPLAPPVPLVSASPALVSLALVPADLAPVPYSSSSLLDVLPHQVLLLCRLCCSCCVGSGMGGQSPGRFLGVIPQGLLGVLSFLGTSWGCVVWRGTLNLYIAPSVSGHCSAYPQPLVLALANRERGRDREILYMRVLIVAYLHAEKCLRAPWINSVSL